MTEYQRCKACGRRWPSYYPERFRDVLWLVFIQLPAYWYHFHFACPKRTADHP